MFFFISQCSLAFKITATVLYSPSIELCNALCAGDIDWKVSLLLRVIDVRRGLIRSPIQPISEKGSVGMLPLLIS